MTGWVLGGGARGFAFGWLAGLVAFMGLPLGSMALLLVHGLTGGRWGEALRPGLRAGVWALVLVGPGVVPVLLMMGVLYPWVGGGGAYLSVGFVLVRLAVCGVVWAGLAVVVLRGRGVGAVAGVGLFVLALTWTSASVDLVMSLDPRFNSSIWGMLTGCEAVLLALAAAAWWEAGSAGAALEDVAKLLLAVVMLWAYLEFMQLLIVWQSNLPGDAPWYAVRMSGGWGVVMAVVAVLRFVVPFFVLLVGAWRRRAGVVRAVAGVLMGSQVLRSWWLVLPSGGLGVGVVDGLAMLAFGGLAFGVMRRVRDA